MSGEVCGAEAQPVSTSRASRNRTAGMYVRLPDRRFYPAGRFMVCTCRSTRTIRSGTGSGIRSSARGWRAAPRRSIPAIDEGQPESAWVAERLGRPVIKAFNNIYFASLLEKGTPKGTTGRIALPVAGDSPAARAKVMRLVDDLGFDPVVEGTIEESWRQQPGTPCYTRDLEATRLTEALAAAERSQVPEYRKAADDAARAFFENQNRG